MYNICTSLLILIFIKSQYTVLHILLLILFYYLFLFLFLFSPIFIYILLCYVSLFYFYFFCTVHWADLSWLTFPFWLYPVWLCMWRIIKNLEYKNNINSGSNSSFLLTRRTKVPLREVLRSLSRSIGPWSALCLCSAVTHSHTYVGWIRWLSWGSGKPDSHSWRLWFSEHEVKHADLDRWSHTDSRSRLTALSLSNTGNTLIHLSHYKILLYKSVQTNRNLLDLIIDTHTVYAVCHIWAAVKSDSMCPTDQWRSRELKYTRFSFQSIRSWSVWWIIPDFPSRKPESQWGVKKRVI